MTNNNIEETQPVWSPDGKQIAFIGRGKDYVTRIWVINADGTDERIISDNLCCPISSDSALDWSNDGRFVFNYSYSVGTIDIEGNPAQPQLKTGARQHVGVSDMTWSPKGELAFIRADSSSWIVTLDAGGTVETVLASRFHASLPGIPDYLEWSPQGDRLVLTLPVDNVQRIFAIDRYGGNLRLIGSPDLCPRGHGCWNEHDPTWSPDGSQIAFYGGGGTDNISGIWVMDSNGSNRENIWTYSYLKSTDGLSWSPTKIP